MVALVRLAQRIPSVGQQVAEAVLDAIARGEFRPGDRISEAHLTRVLGVSRTPIRDGLALLTAQGLLTKQHNVGWSVARPSAREMLRIFEAREAVEAMAARLMAARPRQEDLRALEASLKASCDALDHNDMPAFRHADLELHRCVVHGARNPYLSGDGRAEAMVLLSFLVTDLYLDEHERPAWMSGAYLRRIVDPCEHILIVEAITQGRPEAAEQAMRHHLAISSEFVQTLDSGQLCHEGGDG